MIQIEDEIKLGPNVKVDFLSEIDELVDFAKVCTSFANNLGGSVFLGVNEKGKILGINPDSEQKSISQVKDVIVGDLLFESITHIIKHHCIIEVKIQKAKIPLLVRLIEGSSVYYFRVDSKTVLANKIIERYLNLKRFGKKVVETSIHIDFLNKLGDDSKNLSRLYKMMELKPKDIDGLTADLLFLKKLKVCFIDEKFYFKRI